MKKIKLLISSVNLNYGGIEKSLVNMINALSKEKYEITLVLEKKEGIYLSDLDDNVNIKEYTPSKSKIFNLFKRIKWLLSNYNRYDLSICYATYSLPANFIARASSKKKIFFVHSNYFIAFNGDKNKFHDFFDVRHLDSYDKIVYVSNEIRKDMENEYTNLKNKGIVINNIVNISEILKLSREDIDDFTFRKKTGCFIGRLEEDSKKVSKIIDVAKKTPEVDFIIIGDGPDREKYCDAITNKKICNIFLVGEKKNPYKYLNKSNFLILTSRYEGFPVVYNEAIILNKPILTTVNVSDDEISIPHNFGIISSYNELSKNINSILQFETNNVDFKKINERRIRKIEKMIEDLYEEN